MIKAAVTGSIGSGKTTVCKIFEKIGIPVFNCDDVAKEMLYKNKDKIKDLFGESIFDGENINRKSLAKVVFNNKEELKKLTNITFPLVETEISLFWEKYKDNTYTIVENAILFETGGEKKFDIIITVTTDDETRLKRVMARDNSTIEEVEARLKNQLPELYKIQNSDFIIFNDFINDLEEQVEKIHKKILE